MLVGIGQTYLLFVDYDPSVRAGVLALGPIGVFAVDSAGMLTALLDSSELKNDIAKRFGNSLSQLKVTLASHKLKHGFNRTGPSQLDVFARYHQANARTHESSSATVVTFERPSKTPGDQHAVATHYFMGLLVVECS